MAVNNYGDIPDEFPTKKHLPLGTNIWGMFKQYGWIWLKKFFKEFGRTIGDLAKIRLTESIFTAREVVSGKIPEEEASKTLTYCFFPPTMAIRADLQQGTMKLLFGESSDTTFLFLDDFDKDILFALNTHIEDGYPVDYWHIISGEEDDDFFDRRHMKLGYKFRDIPKKSKTLDQAAQRLIDVLKDARNERTPKWNNSAYHIIITWCSAGLNMVMENSNFETIGCMFDGLASKMFYGLKNFWFNFVPVPTFIGSMARMDRQKFLKMFAGLTCESKLYLQPVEEEAHPLIKEIVPECFDFMRKRWLKGIILPWQTLGREIPNLKKLKKEEEFSHQYPDDPNGRLKGEEIGLNFEDSLKGNYLDVSWDRKKEDITSSDIISSGHGRETVFKK